MADYMDIHPKDGRPMTSNPETPNTRIEADALRYRYLRSKHINTIQNGGVFGGMTPENIVLNFEDLDEAIDNEMAETETTP